MKVTITRIACALLAFAAVFALAACGGGQRPPRDPGKDTYREEEAEGTTGYEKIEGTEKASETEPIETETEPQPPETQSETEKKTETEPPVTETEPPETEPIETETEPPETESETETEKKTEQILVDDPPEIKPAPTYVIATVKGPGSLPLWCSTATGKDLVSVEERANGMLDLNTKKTLGDSTFQWQFYLSEEAMTALNNMATAFNMETEGSLSIDTGDLLVLCMAAVPEEYNGQASLAGYDFAENAAYADGSLVYLNLKRLSVDKSGKTYTYQSCTINPGSSQIRTANAALWLRNFAASYGFIADDKLTKSFDAGYYRYVGKGIAAAINAMTDRNLQAEEGGTAETLEMFLAEMKDNFAPTGNHLRVQAGSTIYEMWYVEGADSDVYIPMSKTVDMILPTGDGYVVSIKN